MIHSDGLPPVLDATCGARMMWFDKNNPLVLFVDRREVEPISVGIGRNAREFSVSPDVVADFTNLPFDDDSFSLVVFDPPHFTRAGENSFMGIKYGKLPKEWHNTIHDGFHECMRVLKPNGVLIFKWNETQIYTSEIIKVVGVEPLFGHISGKKSNTHWMCFMKSPASAGEGE
jgi:SAM-dependent methyltransferase